MGNRFNVSTTFALVDMTTQYRSTAGQYLTYIFKDNRPDPSLVLGHKLYPVGSKYSRNMRRKGKTVPTTDLLIAAAAEGKAVILHVDSDFETIGSIIGLRHEKLLSQLKRPQHNDK